MIRVRVCEVCGKEFAVENRSRRILCSPECVCKRAREYRKEVREDYKKVAPVVVEEKKPGLSAGEIARLAKPYGMSYGEYVAWKGL